MTTVKISHCLGIDISRWDEMPTDTRPLAPAVACSLVSQHAKKCTRSGSESSCTQQHRWQSPGPWTSWCLFDRSEARPWRSGCSHEICLCSPSNSEVPPKYRQSAWYTGVLQNCTTESCSAALHIHNVDNGATLILASALHSQALQCELTRRLSVAGSEAGAELRNKLLPADCTAL